MTRLNFSRLLPLRALTLGFHCNLLAPASSQQTKRLFQVFQRRQSRDTYEGTRIGLALCRKIAEHHKGRIWAESAVEGLGSFLLVVLPVLRGRNDARKH